MSRPLQIMRKSTGKIDPVHPPDGERMFALQANTARFPLAHCAGVHVKLSHLQSHELAVVVQERQSAGPQKVGSGRRYSP